MKTRIFIWLLLTGVISVASGQSSHKGLKPPMDYYERLKAFKQKPQSSSQLDILRFEFDPASAESRLRSTPYYLKDVTIQDFKMTEPPANSSEQTRAELNYLLNLQNSRSHYDIESSKVMAGIFYSSSITPKDSSYQQFRQNLFHIGRSIGTWFNPDNLPLTADLIAHVWKDASYFIWSYKYKFARVRPYSLEKDLDNLEDANWPAYPSGHAGNSYVNAYVFSALSPENKDVFLRDAFDMAHSREILGVHYPSDSESARILAEQLVNKLFKNEQFLKDFEEVKREWENKAKETFVKPSLIERSGLVPAQSCGAKQNTSCAVKCR